MGRIIVAVVLAAILCGCSSQADKEQAAKFKVSCEQMLDAYKKALGPGEKSEFYDPAAAEEAKQKADTFEKEWAGTKVAEQHKDTYIGLSYIADDLYSIHNELMEPGRGSAMDLKRYRELQDEVQKL